MKLDTNSWLAPGSGLVSLPCWSEAKEEWRRMTRRASLGSPNQLDCRTRTASSYTDEPGVRLAVTTEPLVPLDLAGHISLRE